MGDRDVGIWILNHLQKGEAKCCHICTPRKDEDVEALLYVISIIQLDWIAEPMDKWKNDKKRWTF